MAGDKGGVEQLSQLAVKITQGALGSLDHAHGQIGDLLEPMGHELQGFAFSMTGLACDQGKTAVSGHGLDAVCEALDPGKGEQGFVWQRR